MLINLTPINVTEKLITKLIHASYYILYYDRTDPFKIFYLEKRRYLSAVIQNFVWGNNNNEIPNY